jgi:hypothetical protein
MALNHCMHGSAMQVVIGHIAFKGKWRTLTCPTSDTDDPINTKIFMVHYVGDMMEPYQNGVDRMQGGVYTDMQHITKCFRFFPFLFPLALAQPKRLERF